MEKEEGDGWRKKGRCKKRGKVTGRGGNGWKRKRLKKEPGWKTKGGGE